MQDIYSFLKHNSINYLQFTHPAVFTCDEASRLCPLMPGHATKNLFLYSKPKDQYFFVVIGYDKSVDLKKLKALLGVSDLSFASEEQLKKYIGVEPGSVTILGLMHDSEHKVAVFIDAPLCGNALQCHPLVNTATLVIDFEDIERFLQITGHAYQCIDVPAR